MSYTTTTASWCVDFSVDCLLQQDAVQIKL